MGGELIADIIEKAPYLKDESLNLILQPMSKQAHLRRYLASRGFKISEEKYTTEGKHNYVTMLAKYVGAPYEISALEAEIGYPSYDFSENAARLSYVLERERALSKSLKGKELGGISDSGEAELLLAIKRILKGDLK
jgi:tRNA (adenine22-N1)-methyltransferase